MMVFQNPTRVSPESDPRWRCPGEQTIALTENMLYPRAIRIFARMSSFVRKAMYRNRLFCDPFRVKRAMGTVGVTCVGMFGKVSGESG